METCNEYAGVFVEDIEDLVAEYTADQRNNRKYVVPKVKKKKFKSEEAKDYNPPICDSIIPGTQRILIKTWGCSHNNSDSEYMAGQLAAYGYHITDDKDTADLWLLNSCTVKNPSEDHFRNEIKAAKDLNKHIVLAGCVPQGQPKSAYIQGLSIVGVQQIDRIVEVVEETLKGYTVRLMGNKRVDGRKGGGAALNLPKIRKNPLVEIIAINTGCLNQCTYCKTKHARGELGSYGVVEVVERAREAIMEGVVEIWLTSEDLGAYGRDINTSLPQLLSQLLEVIPMGCMVRLGMTNPPYIMEHLEAISSLLQDPRVYSFLHLPVQSGSNSVLYDMRREYTREDFEDVVNFMKQRLPNVTIATDVICGFPTESEKDFEATMSLVRHYHFPSLFINQFFPRPGTPAAKMHKIDTAEVKRRTKLVSELFNSYTTYDPQLGAVQFVLVTDISTDKRFYVGHNKTYDQVLVPMDGDWMGHMIKVRISTAGKHYLMAEVIGIEYHNHTPQIESSWPPHPTNEVGKIIEKQNSKENKGYNIGIKNILKVTAIALISVLLVKSKTLYKLGNRLFN